MTMHASAFDFHTGRTAVVFQDKPLAFLSPALTRAYVAARDSERQFVVMTPSASKLTLPLYQLLQRDGCIWMASAADGTFYNGFTGQQYRWNGDVFAAEEQLAPDYLQAPAGADGVVQARGEILHPASESTRIGEFAAALFCELTGAEPAGWGIHEPVSEPWDTAELTRYCYDTAPMTSNIIVVGRPRPGTEVPSIGVLTVTRSSTGVHESVELFCESVDPLTEDELASFGSAMHRAHARTALAGHTMLLDQLAFPARFTGVSVPACSFFGPEALQLFGPQQALAAAGERARLVGVPPLQSLSVTYHRDPTGGRQHPLDEFTALVGKLAGGKF
ncbi:DUF6177 family protein [Arthrobacter sp.]|uniref:DUF6177 family protein n=1 Tax=Arthrobacter sp. TaxID=1667 RepID=UPI00339A9850